MRLAFIGGCGHHYLRACLSDPACDITRLVPVAGDGCDDERARAFAAALPGETQWFDSAAEMLDTARPDVVSVGAVYARNAEFNVAALQRGISVVSDKPIAATWDDLFRIETVTHGTNRVLLTEFDFRARPGVSGHAGGSGRWTDWHGGVGDRAEELQVRDAARLIR